MKEHSWSPHTRRAFLKATLATMAMGGCGYQQNAPDANMPVIRESQRARRRKEDSVVALSRCDSYEEDIARLLKSSATAAQLPSLKNKVVVIKPNIVEYRPDRPVTTNSAMILATAELADYLGAREIIVAEGPGHFRDTDYLLEATGIGAVCSKAGLPFVDLNLDELEKMDNPDGFMRMKQIFLPKTVVQADALISLPKLKTHHWVGMTASMKNLFGTVPGRKYGWPKNILHWMGINFSIIDLVHQVKPAFAIVDGVVAMEGDGPINGRARQSGFIAAGCDLAAVDATCARAMMIDPKDLPYLQIANQVVGNTDAARIKIVGSTLEAVSQKFVRPLNFGHWGSAQQGGS
jgi:uncharacterized protein (DUF362 family)